MEQEKKEIRKLVAMDNARKIFMESQSRAHAEDKDDSEQVTKDPTEWWQEDEKELFRPITEWTLQRNEWLDVGTDPELRPSFEPKPISFKPQKAAQQANSEETEEEFDWFVSEQHTDDTYFNFVNKNRETIQAGD